MEAALDPPRADGPPLGVKKLRISAGIVPLSRRVAGEEAGSEDMRKL